MFACFVFRACYDFFRFDGAVGTPNFHAFVFGRGLGGLGVACVGFGIKRTDNADNQCADGDDGDDESGADKVFGFELERFVLFFGHRSMCVKVDGDGRDVVPALWIRAALFGLGVVLIQGNDFLHAHGGADALGHFFLFFRCQDTHYIGHVAVGYDFDARCVVGLRPKRVVRTLDVPHVSLVTSHGAFLGGNGDVVVHAFGGLFGAGDLFDELFFRLQWQLVRAAAGGGCNRQR